jgi:acetylglutamate kinase
VKTLIKLGGAALQDPELVRQICADIGKLRASGLSIAVVHGGGPDINAELTARGISWEFRDGQRVTTPEMIDVIEMVLCGKVNRRIVRAMNAAGVRAAGFSGADSQTLLCKRAAPELQCVGEILHVNTSLIEMMLESQSAHDHGTVPVIAPIGVDRKGGALNINADWAASRIAQALGATRVVFLTDQQGVLDERGELISELAPEGIEHLIATQVVKGGMLTKARAVLHALENGAAEVSVLNARRPGALLDLLLSEKELGTRCRKELLHA